MIYHWVPATCPPGGTCHIEMPEGQHALKLIWGLCPFHIQMVSEGKKDQEIFDAIHAAAKELNYACYALKVHLGLDKEHPGLPYSVNDDGGFTIHTGVARRDVRGALLKDLKGRVLYEPGLTELQKVEALTVLKDFPSVRVD